MKEIPFVDLPVIAAQKAGKAKYRIIAMVLVFCLLFPSTRLYASEYEIAQNRIIRVNGTESVIKTYYYSYENNVYVSLRDFAAALKGTEAAIEVSVTKNAIRITTGQDYGEIGGENTGWTDSYMNEAYDYVLKRNELLVDEENRKYYSLISKNASGSFDAFLMLVDLAMMLDLSVSVDEAGNISVNTEQSFCVSPEWLEEEGYFQGVNSVLVGDAESGEVYYSYQADTGYAIASTTKLMTYAVVMDAVSNGEISLEDIVTCSERVEALANSSDGVIKLKEGQEITVYELLVGLLLPSSNESALALAEYVCGSEKAFVERMNTKALNMGLKTAHFYNSNGLPSYTDSVVPAKRQNRMSAEDMFALSRYLLTIYPQITEITSMKSCLLPSIQREVNNSNPLLYNMKEVDGLKTGTTNKAGYCLVTSLKADGVDGEHHLVIVLLGAEGAPDRGRVSELLARYGKSCLYGSMPEDSQGIKEEMLPLSPEVIPSNAEDVVRLMLNLARRNR